MKYSVVDEGVQAIGKWPTKVNAAIRESAKKWEFIARWHKKNPKSRSIRTGEDSCALCQLFVAENGTCDGCPVMLVTDLDYCHGTPYWMYIYGSKEHAAHAATEALFLKGLLLERI